MTAGVNVIIPCFNQAKFLPQAIDSVLAQKFTPLEVIVVNDGSTDDTAKVATGYGNRIKYIAQPNQGLSAARNTGVRAATGEFLHFLDSDDYVLPGCYEHMIGALQKHPEAAAAYGGFRLVNAKDGLLREQLPEPETADWFHRLLEKNPWPCHSLVVRASALVGVGEFDTALHSCEDWDVWLRLAMTGAKFTPVNFIAVCYRKYPQSMSGDPWVMLETGLKVMERNARRHNCAKCKISLANGYRNWRGFCFDEKLTPKLRGLLDAGHPFRCFGECVRGLFFDAPSAWRGLKSLRYQKRRLLEGLAHRS